MPKFLESENFDIQELINTHSTLIHSAAADDDSFSLAQPSPLKYVPNITTNRTVLGPGDRLISQD
jgi:hypothetical protein